MRLNFKSAYQKVSMLLSTEGWVIRHGQLLFYSYINKFMIWFPGVSFIYL
jgi:hypothetical protein